MWIEVEKRERRYPPAPLISEVPENRCVEATHLVEVSIERTEPDRVGCSLGTDDAFAACPDYVAAKGMRV